MPPSCRTSRALAGAAEEIPLPDASVDAITVAQAWHWVDPERALPEAARVLRPGGTLGLIWNRRDERVPWVSRLSEVMGSSDAELILMDEVEIGPPFGPTETFETDWGRPMDAELLLDMIRSRSYFITAAPERRAKLIDGTRALLETDPDLGGRAEFDLPYRTHCFRATASLRATAVDDFPTPEGVKVNERGDRPSPRRAGADRRRRGRRWPARRPRARARASAALGGARASRRVSLRREPERRPRRRGGRRRRRSRARSSSRPRSARREPATAWPARIEATRARADREADRADHLVEAHRAADLAVGHRAGDQAGDRGEGEAEADRRAIAIITQACQSADVDEGEEDAGDGDHQRADDERRRGSPMRRSASGITRLAPGW